MSGPGITKRVLAEAMKELMGQKKLSKISVGDIAGLCGLNRNSFYYHFKDKYDLVNWIFYTEIVSEIRDEDDKSTSVWALLERILEYLALNRRFYMNALSIQGSGTFLEYYGSLVKKLVEDLLEEQTAESEYREFCISFYTEGLVAVSVKWLEGGAKVSAKKLSEMIRLSLKVRVI